MPVIQLFAKPPVAGKVKTRLIPDIGVDNATRVFNYCLQYALDQVRASGLVYQIWLSEASQDSIFRREAYHLQQGVDLGSRMLFAIASQLSIQPQGDEQVVLIGSDCLDLGQHHFADAFSALATNDIVLLPTQDGGFALIGCRVIDPQLFAKVEWSTSRVLQQTIDNARLLNYRVHLLGMVRDIDTLSDLGHYPALLSIIEHN
jgi:rSAM/selenodomain-associated transferase 1